MNALKFFFAACVYLGIGLGLTAGGHDREMARCGHTSLHASDAVSLVAWPAIVVGAVTFAIVYGAPKSTPPCDPA